MKFVIDDENHGKTLQGFLKEKSLGLSSNQIKKAIESKSCKVNDRIECFSSSLLRSGDSVEFDLVEKSSPSNVSILFEDSFFVIIDKPSGLVSENEKVQSLLGVKSKGWRLVHRLDKDTSGLLFLAKTDEAEEAGKALFSQRQVEKIYLAIVDGKIEKKGIIDNLLGKKGGYQGQSLYGAVLDKGLRAITHFKTLCYGVDSSLVLCDLKTGRTHQIRVHLSEKGHPILGDHQYGSRGFKCLHKSSHHLLHAWKMSFIHPFTQKKVELIAPLSKGFQKSMKELFSRFEL